MPLQPLSRSASLLGVIDIQERLLAVMPRSDALIRSTRQLIFCARRLRLPIIVTEQYPEGLGITDTKIAEALQNEYRPISKLSFSCCREPIFRARFDNVTREQRRQVLLCGIETHICILQTCMDLLADGYEVFIVADAVSSRNIENHNLALQQMLQAGAVITSVEAAAYQLLGASGTAEFKELLPLFR